MDLKTLIESVAPTTFGWVLTSQSDFDLKAMLEFRGQLISLSHNCGTRETLVMEPAMVEMPVQTH